MQSWIRSVTHVPDLDVQLPARHQLVELAWAVAGRAFARLDAQRLRSQATTVDDELFGDDDGGGAGEEVGGGDGGGGDISVGTGAAACAGAGAGQDAVSLALETPHLRGEPCTPPHLDDTPGRIYLWHAEHREMPLEAWIQSVLAAHPDTARVDLAPDDAIVDIDASHAGCFAVTSSGDVYSWYMMSASAAHELGHVRFAIAWCFR